MGTRDTAARVRGVSRCAKNLDRTHTRGTRFGSTAGLTVPVLNANHDILFFLFSPFHVVTRAIPPCRFYITSSPYVRTQNPEHPETAPSAQHPVPGTQHPVPLQFPSFRSPHHPVHSVHRQYLNTQILSERGTHKVSTRVTQPPRRSVQHTSCPRARRQAPSIPCLRLQHRQRHHPHPPRLHSLTNRT